MKYIKVLKWAVAWIALCLFVSRFVYGMGNELNEQGDFELTSLGLILTIGTVVMFLLSIFLFLLDQEKK